MLYNPKIMEKLEKLLTFVTDQNGRVTEMRIKNPAEILDQAELKRIALNQLRERRNIGSIKGDKETIILDNTRISGAVRFFPTYRNSFADSVASEMLKSPELHII